MLVDMHVHTQYSHDSSTSLSALADRARILGVHVAVTDHNTIAGAVKGHEIAPDVLHPGVEITTKEGKDVLIYFYTVEELKRFFSEAIEPYLKNKSSLRSGRTGITVQELLVLLSRYKCVTALPHPFAVGPRKSYTFFRRSGRNALLEHIDTYEVVNQAVPHRGNLAAIGWSVQCGKPGIGGSDGHILSMLGTAFTMSKATSWEEFLDLVRIGQTTIVGEERKLRQHMMNMARILREKARVIENRRINKLSSGR